MTIPKGTRQLHDLRVTEGQARKRVLVPIEVVEFYLRYHRQPTKLDLYRSGVLSREYLLELTGPDGGLREFGDDEADAAGVAAATDSGTFVSAVAS